MAEIISMVGIISVAVQSPVIGDIVHYNSRIFKVQHIQRLNARPDEQRYGMSSSVRKVHIQTVEFLFAIHPLQLRSHGSLPPVLTEQNVFF